MNVSAGETAAIVAAAVLCILLLWRLSWLAVQLSVRMLRALALRLPKARAMDRLNPLRAVLAEKYPRTYRFIANRLSPRQFSGLPLTLMVAAAVYLVSLLGGVVEEVLEADEINRIDERINAFFGPYRTDALVAAVNWITTLGDSATLVSAGIVATGFLWAHRRPGFILPLWITLIGAESTTWLGKFVVARERPEFVTVVTAMWPSFPSGHATAAMATYGFIAYAIARDLGSLRARFEITFWTLLLIALVGFSRIFLGVHYASDVAAGFLVGGFWLLVGFAVTEYLRQRRGTNGAEAAPTATTQAMAAGGMEPEAGKLPCKDSTDPAAEKEVMR